MVGGRIASNTLVPLIAASILLLAASVMAFFLYQQEARSDSRIRDMTEMTKSARAVLIALLDAETAERGYVLTGHDDFKEPYRDAKSRVEDNLARLQAFVANDAYSLQKEQIGRLDVLSKEKLEFTDQVVRVAAQDTGRAAALVETRRGKVIMDLARAEIRRFVYDTELLLRRDSQQQAEGRRRMAFLVASMIVLGSVILCVLLLGAYQTIHSKTLNEEQLEQLLKERTENLLQSKEALLAVERQFRVFFDSMPQLGWTAQADGHIDVYNRGWFEYTGTTLEQMAGWGWRSVHDPEILPQVEERWRQSLDNGTPFEMEFPLRRADGIFRWFLTRVTPIKDEE
ncbi:MAG: CHASE3 domain-containing protein, partial [Cyanobacteria bacterium SZAS LIN-2]|nr:CHASE3 domain-containing protein [Cyanobacteria bacterium SZAS LIN-2]